MTGLEANVENNRAFRFYRELKVRNSKGKGGAFLKFGPTERRGGRRKTHQCKCTGNLRPPTLNSVKEKRDGAAITSNPVWLAQGMGDVFVTGAGEQVAGLFSSRTPSRGTLNKNSKGRSWWGTFRRYQIKEKTKKKDGMKSNGDGKDGFFTLHISDPTNLHKRLAGVTESLDGLYS